MNEIDLLLLYHCCLHYRAREPSHKSVLCLDHCLDNILLIRRHFCKLSVVGSVLFNTWRITTVGVIPEEVLSFKVIQ